VGLHRPRGPRRQAARLTAELKQSPNGCRGPLHGIPVASGHHRRVSDMPTGCGSKRWAQSFAPGDANLRRTAQRARLSWASGHDRLRELRPPPTRNPWNLDRTPAAARADRPRRSPADGASARSRRRPAARSRAPRAYCGVYSLKRKRPRACRWRATARAEHGSHRFHGKLRERPRHLARNRSHSPAATTSRSRTRTLRKSSARGRRSSRRCRISPRPPPGDEDHFRRASARRLAPRGGVERLCLFPPSFADTPQNQLHANGRRGCGISRGADAPAP